MKKLLIALGAAGCVMSAQAADILGDTIKGSVTFPGFIGLPQTQDLGTGPIVAGGKTFSNSTAFQVAVDPTTITFLIAENTSFFNGIYVTLKNLSGAFPATYDLTSSSATGFSASSISTVGDITTLKFGGRPMAPAAGPSSP